MISYGHQFVDNKDVEAVANVLKSDWLTSGPQVVEFENLFSQYVGAKYAVAVSSGTAALHLACLASGLKRGEELITSPMTFVASANCAWYCGAKPVFVDIKANGLLDENLVLGQVTKKTQVIIPVHYAGSVCNMEKISRVAKKQGLIVIEDACHALGAEYKGSRVGSCKYSDMSVFSFHPVKHITTGEGGMITTNSDDLYQKLLRLRSHGIQKNEDRLYDPWCYEMVDLGFNYRMTDIQSALGASQLNKISFFIERRRMLARRYDKSFLGLKGLQVLPLSRDVEHAYHLYVIRLKDDIVRRKLYDFLHDYGVMTQVHYIPVYWHPYYQKKGYKKGQCPKAEKFYSTIMSLPMYPSLSVKDQDIVIRLVRQFLKKK